MQFLLIENIARGTNIAVRISTNAWEYTAIVLNKR